MAAANKGAFQPLQVWMTIGGPWGEVKLHCINDTSKRFEALTELLEVLNKVEGDCGTTIRQKDIKKDSFDRRKLKNFAVEQLKFKEMLQSRGFECEWGKPSTPTSAASAASAAISSPAQETAAVSPQAPRPPAAAWEPATVEEASAEGATVQEAEPSRPVAVPTPPAAPRPPGVPGGRPWRKVARRTGTRSLPSMPVIHEASASERAIRTSEGLPSVNSQVLPDPSTFLELEPDNDEEGSSDDDSFQDASYWLRMMSEQSDGQKQAARRTSCNDSMSTASGSQDLPDFPPSQARTRSFFRQSSC